LRYAEELSARGKLALQLIALRCCPQCGQVEIDTDTSLMVVRVGDPKCTFEQEQWNCGTLAKCNEHFAGRFPYIAWTAVKDRRRALAVRARVARGRAASKSDPACLAD
jgi:hypothetical protein